MEKATVKDENNSRHKDDEKSKETISSALYEWKEHITTVNLSNSKLVTLCDSIKFPSKLRDLDISHNALESVPDCVLNNKNLKNLNLSYNKIQYFDTCPNFFNTIEMLDLSHNNLNGPPYWVWTQSPPELKTLILSFNCNLTMSFVNGYLEELLQYIAPVTEVKINNCNLSQHLKLLGAFTKAKVIELGSSSLRLMAINKVIEVPFDGLDQCCSTERLNLCNTQLYTINTNISIFNQLVELNLSENYISTLPEEFCELYNMEICNLSNNQLLYLPDGISKLAKLVSLLASSNELCMLPDSMALLKNLKTLDLYDNCLYEVPNKLMEVAEIDIAQNYIEEPNDDDYLSRKKNLRRDIPERYNGRKYQVETTESMGSTNVTDDEDYLNQSRHSDEVSQFNNDPPSSPEDWDSDDYWVPLNYNSTTPLPHYSWLCFVKRKLEEGNFCPIDAHTIPIVEKVKYEKLCSPKVEHESDGQFDDYSDDNS